jgi:hypothetical protein
VVDELDQQAGERFGHRCWWITELQEGLLAPVEDIVDGRAEVPR